MEQHRDGIKIKVIEVHDRLGVVVADVRLGNDRLTFRALTNEPAHLHRLASVAALPADVRARAARRTAA